ncbi:MarR family winged helix-turn-helix transcriptional regulator [Hydrogenophaga sp.]|uniref:MarR family winged helix-turn-helix transcriptional regulator n=1 Tax=Hydrogenophaga sp. TaxID=1904254 RepID=UPI00356251B2
MRQIPSAELLDRLHLLMLRFHRRMHDAVRDEGDGLAIMEARALAFFARHEGNTQSDLVQHTGRDKAQVARLVKTLLDRDLLESARDPDDGRVLRLALTASGKTMQRKMQRYRAAFEHALVEGFDEAEVQDAIALLDRMVANVGEK